MDATKYRAAEQDLWQFFGLAPTETRVRLEGPGVDVRVQEVGEGDPVLFIHGGPNAGSTWAPFLEHFAGHRSLLVDRPGTGLSDPYPLTLENLFPFADGFVADVLDGLGIERAHIVASSFGGFLALRSAAADPSRVDRMVQMACPAFAPGMAMPPFMKLMTVGPIRKLLNALPPNERVGKSILRQIGHGASLDAGTIPQAFFDWYLALQRHTDTMRNDGDMIGRAGSFRGFDQSLAFDDETLSRVTTPTLFLWGEDDAFGGTDVARRVTSAMPNAALNMLPNSGHLPWIDDPAGIAAASAEFLTAAESG